MDAGMLQTRRRATVAALIATGLATGCSTVATIAGGLAPDKFHCDPNYTIPRVYSGMANDIRFLRDGSEDGGVVIWDMPFSLVADTLALPYTIYGQARYGNLCTKGQGDQ